MYLSAFYILPSPIECKLFDSRDVAHTVHLCILSTSKNNWHIKHTEHNFQDMNWMNQWRNERRNVTQSHKEGKSLSPIWLFVNPWTEVHGILQARILKWMVVPFSRGSSQPRDEIQVSCTAGGFFTSWATEETTVNVKTINLKSWNHPDLKVFLFYMQV